MAFHLEGLVTPDFFYLTKTDSVMSVFCFSRGQRIAHVFKR